MNADKYFFPAGSRLYGFAGVACIGQVAFCPAPQEAGRQGDGQTSAGFTASGPGYEA